MQHWPLATGNWHIYLVKLEPVVVVIVFGTTSCRIEIVAVNPRGQRLSGGPDKMYKTQTRFNKDFVLLQKKGSKKKVKTNN